MLVLGARGAHKTSVKSPKPREGGPQFTPKLYVLNQKVREISSM